MGIREQSSIKERIQDFQSLNSLMLEEQIQKEADVRLEFLSEDRLTDLFEPTLLSWLVGIHSPRLIATTTKLCHER